MRLRGTTSVIPVFRVQVVLLFLAFCHACSLRLYPAFFSHYEHPQMSSKVHCYSVSQKNVLHKVLEYHTKKMHPLLWKVQRAARNSTGFEFVLPLCF